MIAPNGIIRAQFLLLGFSKVFRSPNLYIKGTVMRKRTSSVMAMGMLISLRFSAPNVLVERGQKSWIPPVKKSPMRIWESKAA